MSNISPILIESRRITASNTVIEYPSTIETFEGCPSNHNCSHTMGSLASAGSPGEQVVELLDDPTSAEVEKCFAGSFIVDVRSLTLNATTNRDLDERMVERLKVQFRALIRRYTFADRNLVITTKATFNHIVNYLVAAIKQNAAQTEVAVPETYNA